MREPSRHTTSPPPRTANSPRSFHRSPESPPANSPSPSNNKTPDPPDNRPPQIQSPLANATATRRQQKPPPHAAAVPSIPHGRPQRLASSHKLPVLTSMPVVSWPPSYHTPLPAQTTEHSVSFFCRDRLLRRSATLPTPTHPHHETTTPFPVYYFWLPTHDQSSKRILHCRRSRRRNPPGTHDRPGGRRRPRKRRRSHPRRGKNHSRSHQLHGQIRPRADLPGAHRAALRLAQSSINVADQQFRTRHRVLRSHRRETRRHHRHQRFRSRHHRSYRHRSQDPAAGSRPPGPHVPVARPQWRRTGSRRPDRSVRRSRAHRRPESSRSHLRNHE